MRMQLLILGGDNLLGQSLLEQATGENIHLHAPNSPEEGWNHENLSILLENNKPDCIINLAYYADWFQARGVDTEKLSLQINMIEHLAKLCQEKNIILFQPSSYRVFGGTRITAYNEEDEPLPISILGQALWKIEQIVADSCPKHILLRFGWLLDYNPEGKVARLINRAKTLQEIQLADDRRGNPTPIDDATRVILGMLQQIDCNTALWGTYHYGAMEATSSLTWGQIALNEARNYDKTITENIIAKPHTEFSDASVEPQYAVLSCKKILYTFGIKQRAWRAAIPELFKDFYHGKINKPG